MAKIKKEKLVIPNERIDAQSPTLSNDARKEMAIKIASEWDGFLLFKLIDSLTWHLEE